MIQGIYTVKENVMLCPGVYKMTLLGNTENIKKVVNLLILKLKDYI